MLHHMAIILVCYGGHFEPKMAAKIKKFSNLGNMIWLPNDGYQFAHHNLLANQISPKLENFFILATIFGSKWR
jgi:hypothetical protein